MNDDQVEDFDTEFVTPNGFDYLSEHIKGKYGDNEFRFLDLGGGNGNFTDRLLHAFPKSNGYILDNSELLLNKNKLHDRKILINGSADNIKNVFKDIRFNIIFVNWVFHHLVYSSYKLTTNNLLKIINDLKYILEEDGEISVFENMYDGILINNLPSHIIFHLTSSKLLAPVVKMGGANTAGVGVCFRSKNNWKKIFELSEMEVNRYWEDWKFEVNLMYRLALHMGNVRIGHFWLMK